MRVAIVTESFLPTVNGVTTSVCRVLDHLRSGGHDAIVICPEAGAPDDYAGFRVHQVPSVAYRQFPVGLPGPQVQRILSRFAPDVVHAASPFLLGAQAIAAANRIGVPSVAVYQTDVAGYARRNGLGMTSGDGLEVRALGARGRRPHARALDGLRVRPAHRRGPAAGALGPGSGPRPVPPQ